MDCLCISPMTLKDVDEVYHIEKLSYAAPWPVNAFADEITANKIAHYIVARDKHAVVGYAGMWLILDEAHITNLAVNPEKRQKGIGQRLLCALIGHAMDTNKKWMTLEVRASNAAAKSLYKKFCFKEVGVRPGYYLDNGEDAVIMWSENLQSPDFQKYFHQLQVSL